MRTMSHQNEAQSPGQTRIVRPKTYEEIKRWLVEQVGKQWQPGDRLPPIHQLSRSIGAGSTNTHRAVRELVREGWLESWPRRGTFVRADVSISNLQRAPAAED